MSRKNVKLLYARLATDEAFRTQIQAVESKDECSQILQAAGYVFTQEEFEAVTAELLESNVADDSFRDLSEKELEAVFGGAVSSLLPIPIQHILIYGLPPGDFPVNSKNPIWPVPISPIYGLPSTDSL